MQLVETSGEHVTGSIRRTLFPMLKQVRVGKHGPAESAPHCTRIQDIRSHSVAIKFIN